MVKKSNPNPDYIPPMVKPTADRKCPFRKRYYAVLDGRKIQIYLRNNYLCDYIEEEFQDCIGKECAKWSPVGCSA